MKSKQLLGAVLGIVAIGVAYHYYKRQRDTATIEKVKEEIKTNPAAVTASSDVTASDVLVKQEPVQLVSDVEPAKVFDIAYGSEIIDAM